MNKLHLIAMMMLLSVAAQAQTEAELCVSKAVVYAAQTYQSLGQPDPGTELHARAKERLEDAIAYHIADCGPEGYSIWTMYLSSLERAGARDTAEQRKNVQFLRSLRVSNFT